MRIPIELNKCLTGAIRTKFGILRHIADLKVVLYGHASLQHVRYLLIIGRYFEIGSLQVLERKRWDIQEAASNKSPLNPSHDVCQRSQISNSQPATKAIQ